MKRVIREVILILLLVVLSSTHIASAEVCDLEAVLINQDPYPAIPGEYVKVVFQLQGLGNSECGIVSFQLIEEYPFSLDPEENKMIQVQSGFYIQGYSSDLVAPYKLRIDKSALEGENEISVMYSSSDGESAGLQKFNITLEKVDIDFEISIKDYNKDTETLTMEILNTGEDDVESLVVEIPKQGSISVKGTNRNIIGSLDSNEDTTFNFEAVPKDGEIELKILYNDEIGLRKELTEKVTFDSSYFEGRKRDEKKISVYVYVAILVAIAVAVFYARKMIREKRKKNNLLQKSSKR